ncbi:uncharacterized protein Gasu_45340 [Galdieria sulphuraria]|uniref:Uncharacterized protein n=1 Tax=Galdieria sulphuraria TaxID=130081 RepID=M2XWS3_GALSU|nr:uncharacterized protein Gasu_45340 [Galdieria sulphuraria]EME27869.1 hypothetical protein Gasu_45340 [Galdieria sulphuraria]|eukprot:XP_005704389.1 hypothetical protein Gasu_45340 [Galdieria sulphuraria]
MRNPRYRCLQRWLQTYIDVKLIPVYLLLYAVYRNRKSIGNFFRNWQHTIQQLAHAINNSSDCLLKATNDLKNYLQGNGSEEVPASFVRLLRLFSSPEFVVIFRNVSSGAAQGVCRELISRENDNRKKNSNVTKGPSERLASLVKILEVFTTPSGEQLVSLIISTTVREGLSAVFERYDREAAYALKKRRNGNNRLVELGGNNKDKEQTDDFPPVVKALLDMALSDEGRKFMIDLAVAITATAVPLALKSTQKRSGYPVAKIERSHRADNIQLTTGMKTQENSHTVESPTSPTKKHEKSNSFILPFFRKQNTEEFTYALNEKQTRSNEQRSSRGTSAPGFLDKAAKFFGKSDNKCLSQEIGQNDFHVQNSVTDIETCSTETSQPSFPEKLLQSLLKDHELVGSYCISEFSFVKHFVVEGIDQNCII